MAAELLYDSFLPLSPPPLCILSFSEDCAKTWRKMSALHDSCHYSRRTLQDPRVRLTPRNKVVVSSCSAYSNPLSWSSSTLRCAPSFIVERLLSLGWNRAGRPLSWFWRLPFKKSVCLTRVLNLWQVTLRRRKFLLAAIWISRTAFSGRWKILRRPLSMSILEG